MNIFISKFFLNLYKYQYLEWCFGFLKDINTLFKNIVLKNFNYYII
ncbi:hypothetical protein J658_3391 [Acinetobacter baumannii 573719]|nr:hypothetical protein J658_3391 [Acinetobacter baumannii 573719]